MSLVVLETLLSNSHKNFIELCKSRSKTFGYKLRNAHFNLGLSSASALIENQSLNEQAFSILIMMRAGLNFALGISEALEINNKTVDIHFMNDDKVSSETLAYISGKQVIIVDAVINSGRSIQKVLKQLPEGERKNCKIFTTVMPSDSKDELKCLNIFTIRLSDNKYTGAKISNIQGTLGPDTGDRLFGTM